MADLNYKTFDQLMDSVELDLSRIANNDLIVRSRYIKTARACNAYLGLKLNKQKEERLEVHNFRTPIPEDLLSILAIATYPKGESRCIPKPTKRSLTRFDSNSLNRLRPYGPYEVDSDEDDLIFTFRTGIVDIGYICQMMDEEGNLLVLDHESTNDYYEWSVKEKVFLDLWHNDDAEVQQKLQDARNQLSLARQRAKVIVTAPGYKALKEASQRAERKYYNRFIKMFY
jgi:hypothetical protein